VGNIDLIQHPAVHLWAISSAVIALKTLAVGMYTSSLRIRSGSYISPEDYAFQGQTPKAAPNQDVERARRIHQNDLENHLVFALVGFVYALTEPSTIGLYLCFAGYPVARILHTLFYARGLMPHRTVAYTAGFAITVWMALSSLWSLL
jgi:glutathione S-transferase